MLQSILDYLCSTASFFRFSKDEYVCHEGQQGDSMYIVLQGSIGVYLTDLDGRQTEVSRIESGGFFGEMSIFDKMPRSASCIALEDSISVSAMLTASHCGMRSSPAPTVCTAITI